MLHRPDSLSDTIVACATPPGEGAVAVVRLSGPEALELGRALTPGRRDGLSHALKLARIVDGEGDVLDMGLVAEMHGPNSYTGDHVVELHLHGARAVVQRVLERCQELGARLAQPGEFTQRAFLNGRMSLAQAEAVADLIASRSDHQRRIATAHLQGQLTNPVRAMQDRLEGLIAEWQAALDFPEYETGDGLRPEHRQELEAMVTELSSMVAGARLDLQRPRQVVLCGAPNVGKSTLLNAWAGRERVLVDSAPGTTRDPVEVEITEQLVRWVVCDTAGIRRDAAGLEARGIELSKERIAEADLSLWLLDPEDPQWPEADLDVILVGSKADLADAPARERLASEASEQGLCLTDWVSAKTGEGVGALKARITREDHASDRPGQVVVVRERHVEALREAARSVERCLEAHGSGFTLDVMALELESAARALGAILGRDVDIAVLDRIFADFCIGK